VLVDEELTIFFEHGTTLIKAYSGLSVSQEPGRILCYDFYTAHLYNRIKEKPMPNKVRDWMSSPIIVIDPDSSVSYALTLMRRRGIHSVVVDLTSDEKGKFGIITTTDIRDKIIGEDRNPAETRVSEIMTAPVSMADPDWSLRQCSRKMQELDIHHLPVADSAGTLIGIISATDIFVAAEEIGWGGD
jgi:predicted transcriptional regulator